MTVLPAPPATDQPTFRWHWAGIPSLCFCRGIPCVIVMTLSVLMYKRLNISEIAVARYTGCFPCPGR